MGSWGIYEGQVSNGTAHGYGRIIDTDEGYHTG